VRKVEAGDDVACVAARRAAAKVAIKKHLIGIFTAKKPRILHQAKSFISCDIKKTTHLESF
jgi:hypothetical protein